MLRKVTFQIYVKPEFQESPIGAITSYTYTETIFSDSRLELDQKEEKIKEKLLEGGTVERIERIK